MKLLDAGCYRHHLPHDQQCRRGGRLCCVLSLPPAGMRSYGPQSGATLYAGSDYPERANETILAIAMIRDRRWAGQCRWIAALPGIDALYIGPADLSLALGRQQRADQTDPVMVEALETVLAAKQRHGKVAGLHTGSPEYARAMVDKGFRFVTVATDAGFLENGARRVAGIVRKRRRSRRAGPY